MEANSTKKSWGTVAMSIGLGISILLLGGAYVFAGGPKHTYDSFLIARRTHMLCKRIEPGTFLMGSKDEERRQKDGPQHEVTISKAFYIGVFEVTQQQWNKVMGKWTWSNPSRFGGRLSNPVEDVSWNEVNEFIAALNCGAQNYSVYKTTASGRVTRRASERSGVYEAHEKVHRIFSREGLLGERSFLCTNGKDCPT